MKLSHKLNYFLKYVAFKPKRLWNLLLVKLSKGLKLSRVLGYPLTVMMEPTNTCNLKCPLCPVPCLKRKKGFMKLNEFKKIIDEVGDYMIHLRMWNWGEPLLNKDLDKMIKYAKKKDIFVNTSTNSYFLDKTWAKKLVDSGLDELILSLDGASEKTYNQYRKGGSFKKAIAAIKLLLAERKKRGKNTPKINLQFIIMKHNEHEVEKVKKLAKELGVDNLVLKSVGIMDVFDKTDDVKKYLPSIRKYSRYDLKKGKLIHKARERNMCDLMYEESVVNWDGSITACCHALEGIPNFGNAFKESFKNIWNSKKYRAFRKQILKDKKTIPLCKDCPGSNKFSSV